MVATDDCGRFTGGVVVESVCGVVGAVVGALMCAVVGRVVTVTLT